MGFYGQCDQCHEFTDHLILIENRTWVCTTCFDVEDQ